MQRLSRFDLQSGRAPLFQILPHARLVSKPTMWRRDRYLAVTAFYKGESQAKKHLRRLEGAKTFAALSSPSHVEGLWGIRSS